MQMAMTPTRIVIKSFTFNRISLNVDGWNSILNIEGRTCFDYLLFTVFIYLLDTIHNGHTWYILPGTLTSNGSFRCEDLATSKTRLRLISNRCDDPALVPDPVWRCLRKTTFYTACPGAGDATYKLDNVEYPKQCILTKVTPIVPIIFETLINHT